MIMFGVALRSVRSRGSAFLATFLGMFAGAVILMSFASLLDTRNGNGISAADKDTLATMAMVIGSLALVIVTFAVFSTLTLTVRQRSAEMALLKSVGATPGQVSRMIVGEAAVLAVVAAVLAMPVAVLGGWGLLKMLGSSNRVAGDITYHFGPTAIGVGVGVTLIAGVAGAALTARRTVRMTVTESLTDASVGSARMSRKRVIAGWVFLAIGLDCGILTATLFKGKGLGTTQSVAGEAVIWSAIGMAVLSPALIRVVISALATPLRRLGGASGYLGVLNVRQRTQQMAGALTPIILFTALGSGTLYMQSIDNSLLAASGRAATGDDKGVETLNYVVVGVICVFAAIVLINSLVSATIYRRREFGQQRLVGSTPPQVLRMVSIEGVALILTGLVFGSIAGLVAVIPYSIARTDSVIPDTTIGIYLAVVAAVVVLTLGASVGAARRAIRIPAVEAVAA